MENNKKLSAQIMELMGNIAFITVKKTVRAMLYVDRKFWKGYVNIETPLYKAWWKRHAAWMQKKLDETQGNYAPLVNSVRVKECQKYR